MLGKQGHDKQSVSFHMLHAIYHQRDFRVRMSELIIDFVRKTLLEEIEKAGIHVNPALPITRCPACSAGYKIALL